MSLYSSMHYGPETSRLAASQSWSASLSGIKWRVLELFWPVLEGPLRPLTRMAAALGEFQGPLT